MKNLVLVLLAALLLLAVVSVAPNVAGDLLRGSGVVVLHEADLATAAPPPPLTVIETAVLPDVVVVTATRRPNPDKDVDKTSYGVAGQVKGRGDK